MILKKITLNNIRSYNNQTIEFPEGSTLLSGDIGSGKTSVLLGIEFALFGLQPGQRGSALLKNGEKEGSVTMEFEVDDKKILVERKLKRGKTISQEYCSITIDGDKREFSVTELKDKVLEILSYPKEFSKRQNLLYKFTIYTPQEEMKQIILEDPETRTNTLRYVFGIDKYKKILENVSILASRLREEKRIKEAMLENMEQDKANLISKEEEIEAKHYNLVSVEKELFIKTEERKKVQEEKEQVLSKIEEKKKLQQEIEKTKIMVLNKKESTNNNVKTIEQLRLQINELSTLKFDENQISSAEQQIALLKKEKEKLNEENLKIYSQIHSLTGKNQESQAIKENIKHIEICPTCLQGIGPVYRGNVVNKLDSDIAENMKKIEEFSIEKKTITENIKKTEEQISLAEKMVNDLKILKIKLEDVEEKKKRMSEIEKTNALTQKDLELLDGHIKILNNSVFELNKFDSIFDAKQRQFENSLREERNAEIKVAELRKEIEVFSRQIEEFRERIKKTEEMKKKVDHLIKIEAWLSKDFTSLISTIEKNVMIKLKVEFSKLFAKWFSMLVSDVFDVRLDDDFTPIIEHQDYEIDYSHLSGGERTAIALAYRLSLNQVVHSLLSKVKTRDLVILDEPTDGFSEQQLDKMRDIFRQMEVRQLIIVSHEQKIESFVENVIRFRKDNGISRVESVAVM
ncbi:AAA family ATPase [Candidatus Pacearchaeota archaeon]|nr:AAA family ATPase [Candidatus Pacearchaeota archaeon]